MAVLSEIMESYWVIIAVLSILILIAIDPRSWGSWARAGWKDLGIKIIGYRESDLEVRARYRRIAMEHIPNVPENAMVKFSDPTLDMLLFENKFDEANRYRMEQMMLARERKDGDALETYTIYKNIISMREAEFDEDMRRHLRDKYPKPARTVKAGEPEYDPMEIVEPPEKKEKRKKSRTGFIEIEWKGLPIRPPLKPEKDEKPEAEYLGEKIGTRKQEFDREPAREPSIKSHIEPVVMSQPEPIPEEKKIPSVEEPPRVSEPAVPDDQPTPIDGFVNENDISPDEDEYTGLIQV